MSPQTLRRASCAWLFLLVLAPRPAHTSPCAPLTPEASEYGYKELENRCEGFYVPKLRGFLQVVSFTPSADPERLAWDERTRLVVVPLARSDDTTHIRAVSLERDVFYQMDASLDGANSLEWPVGRYLHPRNIRPDQLGVYGWSGTEDEKTFTPVRVGGSGGEGDSDPDPDVVLKMRTVLNLTHFRWSLLESGHAGCRSRPGTDDFTYFEGDMSAGRIISITLPRSEAPLPRCLEIQYRPEDRRWKSQIIRVRI